MDNELLGCPECGSLEVTAMSEQMFMVNTGEHYCHSVKPHDADAKATCLDCRWTGRRNQLATHNTAIIGSGTRSDGWSGYGNNTVR